LKPLFNTKLLTKILLNICLISCFWFYHLCINEGYEDSIHYDDGSLYYSLPKYGDCSFKIEGKINSLLENTFKDILKKPENDRCKSYKLNLNSGGGNLGIAMEIGDIVLSKRMTTIVLDKCKSACMYLFISGHTRIASKYSILGLHQSIDIKSKACSTPEKNNQDNSDYFKTLEHYVDIRLGAKTGKFFMYKDNVASCKEMLHVDNEEFLQKGIITELTSEAK
jgi:ATP-dependent protease ClpP protease subunit